ncbi:MAG: vWA domain-containing protein [Polyangiaceae bacterium]
MSISSVRLRRGLRAALLGAGFVLLAWACSTPGSDIGDGTGGTGGSSGSSGSSGSGGTSAGSAGANGSAGSSGSSGSNTGGSIQTDGGSDVETEGCATIDAAATRFPLTLLILLDQSSSMGEGGGTKWTGAKAGLKAFLESAASKDINVGLNLFPRVPQSTPICSVTPFMTPTIDFAKLQGTSSDTQAAAILGAIPDNPAGVGTPIYTALGGSLQLLQSKSQTASANGKVENFAVLLITDGNPAGPPGASDCSVNVLDQDVITNKVDFFLQNGNVRTFVVGLQGISASFGNAVAASGGTGTMIQIDSADVAGSFAKALADIRGDSLGCEFTLPSQVGTEYSTDKVNVRYTPSNGDPVTIGKEVGCATGKGWQYDNDSNPTKIILCPNICDTVKQDPLAEISVVLGCPSEIIQ